MKTFIPTLFLFLLTLTLPAQNIMLELFQNGFNDPVDLQNAGDDRLFVVEKGGRIKIMLPDGTVNATPFLNIASQVSGGSEQGLLGLAFHPDYATNGYYYVNYTKTNGDTRISRFSVDPGDPDITLAGSELTILEFAQPFTNHNGGGVAFGPDGYLYISTGDGGSGGDPGNRAQNTTILLGKLLRIDIDNPGTGIEYSIPSDNPFFGSATNAEEIWAYGLRNPWRFSFDSANGDIWIGDVGQGDVEEIDRAGLTEAGLNYGWRCYEGSQPYNTSGCPPMGDLTFPIAEYSSSSSTSNCSVTGGYVYRGSTYLDLQGLYFFGDVCSGFIGTVDDMGTFVNHGTLGVSGTWVAFGQDMDNELYAVSLSGSIYKVTGDIIAGTSEFEANKMVSLIPNPASENLRIEIENDQVFSVTVVDLKGRVIASYKDITESERVIDVSSFSQGLYLVKVFSVSGNSYVKKLVIE